jgi:hypothetical protein
LDQTVWLVALMRFSNLARAKAGVPIAHVVGATRSLGWGAAIGTQLAPTLL